MTSDKLDISEEPDIQSIYDRLMEYFEFIDNPFHELNLISRRFYVDLEDGPNYNANGFGNYLLHLITEVNDSGQMHEFLTFILNKDTRGVDNYTKILHKYGYDLDIDDNDQFHIIPLGEKFFEEESKQIQTFLEQNAPPQTLIFLSDAKENFSKQKFDDALISCRKALESLTTNGNFSNGVNQLISVGLIQTGDQNRKNDAEMLRACYGYASTLGAHTGSSTTPPDSEQALVGMIMTQSCIRFILKRITSFSQQSTLTEWHV